MLVERINKIYIAFGFGLYFLFALFVFDKSEKTATNAVSFISFLIFAIVTYHASKRDIGFYKIKNLATIVFTVSILEVTLFHILSYYIEGDTFVFSKSDAILYHNIAMRTKDMSIIETIDYISNTLRYGIDDWGAMLWTHCVYAIWPSQQFLGFMNCIVGTLTSVLLFDLSRNFMPRRYAFFAALSFSVASFVIVFHSQFLKETIMTLFIVAAFNSFITYIRKRNNKYIWLCLFLTLILLLFRTPIALLLLLSFGITWVLLYMKGPVAITMVIILGLTICSTPLFTAVYDRYLRGGNTEVILERKKELAQGGGVVNHVADPLAALAGPFPSIKVKSEIKPTYLYASGLLYRFLLSAPFFLGVFYIIKRKHIRMYPLAIFFLANAIGVAISVKGLETRLSLPHLGMMYIIAFWFLAKHDYNRLNWIVPKNIEYAYFAGILGLCLLWNFR